MTRRRVLAGRRITRVLSLGIAAVALGTGPAVAQTVTPQPLSKSDVVRLVVTDAYSPSEKAALIRNSCLSFDPTSGDWNDIEALGAPAQVLEAIRGCVNGAPASGPPRSGLAVDLAATRVTTVAGDTATIVATVTVAGGPVPDLSVTLTPSSGSSRRAVTRRTGAEGRVVFRVPAGTRRGQARFRLSSDGGPLTGDSEVVVVIRAAAPADANVSPDSLLLSPDDVTALIQAVVTDRYDNPSRGAELFLKTDPSDSGLLIGTATTDNDGLAVFNLDSAVVAALVAGEDRQTWTVVFGGVTLATVAVELESDRAAEAEAAALAALGIRPTYGVVETDPAGAAAAGHAADGPVFRVRDSADVAFDTAMLAGHRLLEAGQPDSAAIRFRAAVRLDPRSTDAKKALAEASLEADDPEDAAFWYRIATTDDPEDAEAWIGLGHALAASGRNDESKQAFARAVRLDPDAELAMEAEQGASARPPMLLGASVWGGSTFQTDGSGGIREATLRFDPSETVALWGAYDDGLYRNEPWLVRGKDVVQAVGAGAAMGWNDNRMRTILNVRIRDAGFGLQQNLIQLEQRALLSSSADGPELRAGGYLGRWFDGDDWLIYGQVGFGVSHEVRLVPGISTGKTYGSNLTETGRRQDQDTRIYFSVDWQKASGLRITPTLGVGSVSSDIDALDGTLFDLLLDATIPLGSRTSALIFVHHQAPPGSEAFTTLAAGLSLGIDLKR